MTQRVGYYVDLSSITIALNDRGMPESWVHALPGGTYKHPVYGEMQFTDAKVTNLADSVTQKVRGIDPDIDYDHKTDKAMGNKAAGWVMGAETRPSSDGSKRDLWLLVEWTPNGAKSIHDKEYRYFSSEICDEWEDAQGNKHQDVLLGGGITNRPYMKSLMPLNLSELEFIDRPSTEGEQVDPKELRRKLGLAETATDAEVDTKLSELTKPPAPPQQDPNDELKRLAEGNPLVKAFMDKQAAQEKMLADMQSQLTLSNVMRQLGELTNNVKVQLSAAALNEARDLMVALPTTLGEKLFGLLKIVADGTGIVELGERGTADPTNSNRGNDADPTTKFNDAIRALMDKDKLDYGKAAERVALSDPSLFEQYRKSTYIKQQ